MACRAHKFRGSVLGLTLSESFEHESVTHIVANLPGHVPCAWWRRLRRPRRRRLRGEARRGLTRARPLQTTNHAAAPC